MFAALKILRPVNLLFLAFALFGLLWFTSRYAEWNQPFWIGILFIYIFCSTMASGYVINDLFDVETDKINKPEKLIVGKILSIRQTEWMYLLLLMDGLFFSVLFFWFTDKSLFLPIIFSIQISLFLYAKFLKKSLLLGNLLVALLTASPYLVFSYVFDLQGVFHSFAIYLALFAFLLNLKREITKDWEDISGDKAIRAHTFPIRFGEKSTKILLGILTILSLFIHIAVILQPLSQQHQLLYCVKIALPVVVVALMHLALLILLISNNASPKKISSFIKIMMLVGVLWPYYLLIL